MIISVHLSQNAIKPVKITLFASCKQTASHKTNMNKIFGVKMKDVKAEIVR